MSVGTHHRRLSKAHPEKLKALRVEASYEQMWNRPFNLIVTKEVPDSAGYSVTADRFYIDRDFVKAVEVGLTLSTGTLLRVAIPGMSAKQVFEAILIHERTEKSLLDADNSIFTFETAHEFATLAEHTYVRSLGVTPKVYEDGIEQIIEYNQAKAVKDAPADLDCGPYLDDPDEQDRHILAMLRRLYVADSHKQSRQLAHYGRPTTGTGRCGDCAYWSGSSGSLFSMCQLVHGLIRRDYSCGRYELNRTGSGQQNDRNTANRFDRVASTPSMQRRQHPLPEPISTKLIRFGLTNPFPSMAAAIWIAAIGFLFLDRYLPGPGIVWNIINGTISGHPYRYVLAIAAALFLFGCYVRVRPGKPPP